MRKLLGLLVLISGMTFGQGSDTVAVDTVKQIPNYFGGVYFEMGAKLAPNPPGINQTNFIGGGIQYNRWSLGFLVYNFKGKTERLSIFPNIFDLKYRYGGPFISFDMVQSEWFNLSTWASYSKGDILWRYQIEQPDLLRDEFTMLSFGMKLEMSKLRFFRPYLWTGYQKMSDLNLAGVTNVEFSGFFFGAGVRLGFFNQ